MIASPRKNQSRNDIIQRNPKRLISEDEFPHWLNEFTRAEWVNGRVAILPLADLRRGDLQGWLLCVLGAFVETHDLGRIAGSKLLFRLNSPPSWRMTNLYYVAKKRMHLFRYDYFDGAPDLVVEIISPKLRPIVYREKFVACENAGVKEHWSVDPDKKKFEMHRLVSGKYQPIPEIDGNLHSQVLKGLVVKPASLWQTPLPKISQTLRELGIR